MKRQTSPLKPWHKPGISKKQYLATRPWKRRKNSREKFEDVLMAMPQEALDEIRIEVETEELVEEIFGE